MSSESSEAKTAVEVQGDVAPEVVGQPAADPTGAADPAAGAGVPAAGPSGDPSDAAQPATGVAGSPAEGASADSADKPKRRILIGSQRDPAAYRPRPKLNFTAEKQKKHKKGGQGRPQEGRRPAAGRPGAGRPDASQPSAGPPPAEPSAEAGRPAPAELPDEPSEFDEQIAALDPGALRDLPGPSRNRRKFPPPNLRSELSPELEAELQQAMADAPLDDLMAQSASVTVAGGALLEPESVHTVRVLGVHRDNVFVELGGREQGVVAMKLFEAPPEPGTALEVRVSRFRPEEGLYELVLATSATDIGDWSDVAEGITVEARVTGHNTGGLECEVNRLRGFIPVSQIALYRVENLEEFVGQSFTCLVTEANPERRNLVLSRRALLEREREQAREAMWETLAAGQVHDGVVRKLMDFGAFIDIGGVDGLLHVSQLAWGRVKHPSDVLEVGQAIKVRIEKIDPETRKISLTYRDLIKNPWDDVAKNYPVNVPLKGKVTRTAEFGAFVELEPGIEGLVHISELAHRKVWRVSDVVKEGDEVDVVVLAVDTEARRISLSMKSLQARPEPAKKEKDSAEAEAPPPPPKKPVKPTGPLQGGLGRVTGAKFGLKW